MDTAGYLVVWPTSDSYMVEWGLLLLCRDARSTHSSQNSHSNTDCSLYPPRYWLDLAQQWLLEPLQSLCQGQANENKISHSTTARCNCVAVGRRYRLSLVRTPSWCLWILCSAQCHLLLRLDMLLTLSQHTECRFFFCFELGTIRRAIWYLDDVYLYPNDFYKSAAVSTLAGLALCFCMCSTASLLAPPALFLCDGPSHLPPPIGVTIISSYRSIAYPASVAREKEAKDPMLLVLVDIFISYGLLPFGVVTFW